MRNEEEALESLAKGINMTQPREQRIEKVREQLDKYLLPHLGTTPKSRIYKAYNLCKIIKNFQIPKKIYIRKSNISESKLIVGKIRDLIQ